MTAGASGALELTILMPCLNEAETLGACIDDAQAYLIRSGVIGEVLVADNGSTDGSQAIARAKMARVVDVERRGYGAALAGGIDPGTHDGARGAGAAEPPDGHAGQPLGRW